MQGKCDSDVVGRLAGLDYRICCTCWKYFHKYQRMDGRSRLSAAVSDHCVSSIANGNKFLKHSTMDAAERKLRR